MEHEWRRNLHPRHHREAPCPEHLCKTARPPACWQPGESPRKSFPSSAPYARSLPRLCLNLLSGRHSVDSDRGRCHMAFVIAEPCIGTKDTACVDACPVDCIHPKKNTTYD